MLDWFKRGESAKNNDNPFEAFIYLWISWVIGCRIYISYNVHRDDRSNSTDREDVILWCKNNSNVVAQIIDDNYATLESLGKRKGSKYGDPIVDANVKLSSIFSSLSRYFRNDYTYKKNSELAETFAELLNKIRNNLFHGDKSYNDKQDYDLIMSVLPSLYDLAKETINYSKRL